MKIKVAPLQEIVRHWVDIIKTTTPISLTSLITRVAMAIGALEGQHLDYIQIPRTMINETYLIQGHHLKRDNAGGLVFYFPGYTNVIRLPNPSLRLYNSGRLTFDLQTAELCDCVVFLAGTSADPAPNHHPPIHSRSTSRGGTHPCRHKVLRGGLRRIPALGNNNRAGGPNHQKNILRPPQ